MPSKNPTLERKFWAQKLEIARDNHRCELRKAGQPGQATSMRLLAVYVSDMERAQQALGRLGQTDVGVEE